MRRALVSLLILSLFGGQVAAVGVLLIGHRHVRQQMRRRIAAMSDAPESTSALRHLTLSRGDREAPESSFVRIDEHEFWYRGRLYDIVHRERRGATWHVWVLRDRREERYLDLLARAMEGPSLFRRSAPRGEERTVAPRAPAIGPAVRAALPAPLLRSQIFPRSSLTSYQAPYLEVPHPPPWG